MSEQQRVDELDHIFLLYFMHAQVAEARQDVILDARHVHVPGLLVGLYIGDVIVGREVCQLRHRVIGKL